MSLISLLCDKCLGNALETDHAYKCRPLEPPMSGPNDKGSSDSKRAWSLPAQILAVESILERIQPIQFTFPDRDGLVAVLSTLNELRRADGSAAEVKRLLDNLDEIKRNTVVSSHREAVDEVCEFISALASAYDAVVEAREQERQDRVQAQVAEERYRSQSEALSSRVAELERVSEEYDRLAETHRNLWSALQMAVRQNSGDMVMTGDEIRRCESALNAAERAALSKGAQP